MNYEKLFQNAEPLMESAMRTSEILSVMRASETFRGDEDYPIFEHSLIDDMVAGQRLGSTLLHDTEYARAFYPLIYDFLSEGNTDFTRTRQELGEWLDSLQLDERHQFMMYHMRASSTVNRLRPLIQMFPDYPHNTWSEKICERMSSLPYSAHIFHPVEYPSLGVAHEQYRPGGSAAGSGRLFSAYLVQTELQAIVFS